MRGIGMGLARHGGVRLAGGGVGYLLRDDFLTDAAAPLASPRTCEPGPGTLTITDIENKQSITGSQLAISAGRASPGVGDPGLVGTGLARVTGRALLLQVAATGVTNGPYFGFANALPAGASGTHEAVMRAGSTTTLYLRAPNTSTDIAGGTFATATDYVLGVILGSVGWLPIGKVAGVWTLLYRFVTGNTATLYPFFSNHSSTGITADNFRVLDLPAPFSSDYGLATQRLAGAVAAGTTFTHTADCIIEWTQTTVPTAGYVDIGFRRQDATHQWYVRVDSGGALFLVEYDGSETVRGSSAGVIANGDRIVVIAEGTTIRVYEANTLRITYASAASFATLTAGIVKQTGTGGAVSDLIAWPRTLTGSPAAILDQVSA